MLIVVIHKYKHMISFIKPDTKTVHLLTGEIQIRSLLELMCYTSADFLALTMYYDMEDVSTGRSLLKGTLGLGTCFRNSFGVLNGFKISIF